jgi:hypothetical protein
MPGDASLRCAPRPGVCYRVRGNERRVVGTGTDALTPTQTVVVVDEDGHDLGHVVDS